MRNTSTCSCLESILGHILYSVQSIYQFKVSFMSVLRFVYDNDVLINEK